MDNNRSDAEFVADDPISVDLLDCKP